MKNSWVKSMWKKVKRTFKQKELKLLVKLTRWTIDTIHMRNRWKLELQFVF